jgi:hypothetical protein
MKVICKHTNGDSFSQDQLPFGFNPVSQTNLILDKEYLVMGIYLVEQHIYYLVDENSKPYWFPCILFEMSDSRINADWHIKITNTDKSLESIQGYFELCYIEGYNDRLMERDEEEMRTYFKQKIATEESFS